MSKSGERGQRDRQRLSATFAAGESYITMSAIVGAHSAGIVPTAPAIRMWMLSSMAYHSSKGQECRVSVTYVAALFDCSRGAAYREMSSVARLSGRKWERRNCPPLEVKTLSSPRGQHCPPLEVKNPGIDLPSRSRSEGLLLNSDNQKDARARRAGASGVIREGKTGTEDRPVAPQSAPHREAPQPAPDTVSPLDEVSAISIIGDGIFEAVREARLSYSSVGSREAILRLASARPDIRSSVGWSAACRRWLSSPSRPADSAGPAGLASWLLDGEGLR